jgi:hypothetical protein
MLKGDVKDVTHANLSSIPFRKIDATLYIAAYETSRYFDEFSRYQFTSLVHAGDSFSKILYCYIPASILSSRRNKIRRKCT